MCRLQLFLKLVAQFVLYTTYFIFRKDLHFFTKLHVFRSLIITESQTFILSLWNVGVKSKNGINGSCPFSHGNNYINSYLKKVHWVGREPRAIAEPIKGWQLPSVPEKHLNPGNIFTKHTNYSHFQQQRYCPSTEMKTSTRKQTRANLLKENSSHFCLINFVMSI